MEFNYSEIVGIKEYRDTDDYEARIVRIAETWNDVPVYYVSNKNISEFYFEKDLEKIGKDNDQNC